MPSNVSTLTFTHPVNASLQVGDVVYYSSTGSSGAFSTVVPTATIEFGTVNFIDPGGLIISVIYDSAIGLPTTTDYITFAKNKQVNSSSLVGYYAEAKFINNSKQEANLFSVGSEVSQSSK
tara:strand:+ start:5161 stop:5523 length:363 start_codon:yes stop_codon:yes gene_type:complete